MQNSTQGTWSEGKVVNGTNVGGGVFTPTPSGTTTSPTVVSNQGRFDAIPGIVNKANNYTATTGNAGNTATTGTNGNTASTGNTNGAGSTGNSYEDFYNTALGNANGQPVDPTVQAELNLISSAKSNNDAVMQSSIAAIHNQYQARLADTQAKQASTTAGIEQSLNLGGSSRYAPVSSSGILSSKEKFDLQELNDLQASENSQIAQLKQAQVDNDYKAMSQQLAILDKTRQEKITLAQNIAQNMASTSKDARDKLMAAQADASKTALANGAPKAVIDAIANAKSTSEAYSAAAGYGGGGNIDVEKITNVDGSQSIVRVDKNTGKIVGTTNIGGGAPVGAGSALSPVDYKDFITGLTPAGVSNFNKLSPEDQSNVKQLINGDALLSDLFTSRGTAGATLRQQALQKAQSVDPTFSENTNKNRVKFQQQWNNPSTGVGKVNNSINTALGHLADTKQSSDQLDGEGLKIVNKATNWIDTQTGNSTVLKLKTDLTALATEIATIYKGGTQPSEPEIHDWKQVLSADYSKGQMTAVENEIAKLLSSKITSQRYAYKTAMGKELSTPLIDPEKKQALIDAGIDPKVIAKENVPGQPKTGIAAQIDTATSQGYKPQDIVTHLQSDPTYGEKIQAAQQAGWSPEDILNYLNTQ